MITKFSLLKRRSDLTQAQYLDHWRNKHVRVLIEQGGHQRYNKRYVQNHFSHGVLDICSTDFDGAAQLVPQRDSMVLQGFQEDPLYQQYVRPDENEFLDVKNCVVLYCETHTVREAVSGSKYKFISLLSRAPQETQTSFLSKWRGEHSALVESVPEFWRHVRGYTQHAIIPEATRGMASGEKGIPASRFDGVSEFYFDDLDALRSALVSPAYHDIIDADERRFARNDGLSFIAREEFIYDIS